MKKLLLVLLLTAMGMFKGHSQALVQTYVDRCTGAVMVFSVPMNGSTVVAFYNKSRVFTAQDFQNGTLQAWLEETYLWWTSLSPCSTSTTGAQATQQTTQQTTQQATQAATNAASNAAANTTANVPTTPTTPPPSTSATTQPTTTAPDTSSSNTTSPDTTGTGGNASSQGNSTSGTGGSETSTSNSQSNQGSTESTSGNETTSTEQSSEGNATGSEDSSGGDTGSDSSSETEVESTTEETSTEESTTEESTTEESTEETSSEESTEESTEESNESETEEETTDEQSEEETTEEESNEESEESESEEESDESSEEDSEEEETEEESESDEDEETEEEESEEESSNEDEEEDDEKKKKKRNLAPPIVTANALSQQLPTGEFQQAVTFGISQSSLMGTETYGLNAMVYDNLQQYMLTANFSKVHINKEGRINRVYSASLGAMKMYSTFMAMMNHSMTFLGKKGSVAGIALGTSLTSNNVDVIDGAVYFDNQFLGVSLTGFYTRSFTVSPKLSVSPMVAASSPFMMFDMYKHNTMWNKDVMIIAGSNFTYRLTQRFGLNIGANIIESTAPEFPTMKTFTIGGRLSF